MKKDATKNQKTVLAFPAGRQRIKTQGRALRNYRNSGDTNSAARLRAEEKPDAKFYEAMRQLSTIGNNINQLAVKANALGFIDVPMLKAEALRWHKFQADIESVFLRPGESNLKWQ